MERHQKKITYSEGYKNATGKGLLSCKGNEVFKDIGVFEKIQNNG